LIRYLNLRSAIDIRILIDPQPHHHLRRSSMHPWLKTTILLALVALLALPAAAELLVREDFDGVSPETFAAYPDWDWDQRDFDFGPFSVAGWYDTYAYFMPIAAPVELPTIGGDNLTITLHPPVAALGFDLGAANFGETTIAFLGQDENGASIELASFLISQLMDDGSGPAGYQGFVGFQDDQGREIHQVTVGPIDLYLDNVYVGGGGVGSQSRSLSGIKALYR
jgi:hypothetical protein